MAEVLSDTERFLREYRRFICEREHHGHPLTNRAISACARGYLEPNTDDVRGSKP